MEEYIVIYARNTGKAEVEDFTDKTEAESRFRELTLKPLPPEQTTQVNDSYSKRIAGHQSLKEGGRRHFAGHEIHVQLKSEAAFMGI